MFYKKSNAGFTLIELMIVMAIIAILVMLALPSYQGYMRRARYMEVVQSASPYRLGVEECYQTMSNLDACVAGTHGVPPAIQAGEGVGLIHTIAVNAGVILIVPEEIYGIHPQDTYILTPQAIRGRLIWHVSGGAVEAGYVH